MVIGSVFLLPFSHMWNFSRDVEKSMIWSLFWKEPAAGGFFLDPLPLLMDFLLIFALISDQNLSFPASPRGIFPHWN